MKVTSEIGALTCLITDVLTGEDFAAIDLLAIEAERPHVITVTVSSWNG